MPCWKLHLGLGTELMAIQQNWYSHSNIYKFRMKSGGEVITKRFYSTPVFTAPIYPMYLERETHHHHHHRTIKLYTECSKHCRPANMRRSFSQQRSENLHENSANLNAGTVALIHELLPAVTSCCFTLIHSILSTASSPSSHQPAL